jgi:MATE family multidrug resistance protein
VLAFSTIDTVLVARHSALDLAALAVGAATYITVFIGLMGVVTSLAPIVGQLYGAGRLEDAGHQLHQAVWIALGLSLLGCTALLHPAPFLALSRAGPELRPRIEAYLQALAWALPAALLFAAWRGFNTAVSRPKQVMVLQLAGLAVKLPLSLLLVRGADVDSPWGRLQLPALGVAGCGIATALAMWGQVAGAAWQLRRNSFYRRFAILGAGLRAPDRQALGAQLRLGIPSGLSVLIDVTGFAFMAIFIARLGAHTVAGHQIVANLAALLFMLPLALAHATSTLVAQRVGAADLLDARRLGWHGLQTATGLALLAGLAVLLLRGPIVRLYTPDAEVSGVAVGLLVWMLAFHLGDALQAVAAAVLRAWRIAQVPMLIHAVALWGVGLSGGYLLAFDPWGWRRAWPGLATIEGAPGFWAAASAGLLLAGLALTSYLAWMLARMQRRGG